ncbi:MAG: ankyrin repeat domain-containing protein [Lacipirellulaceae bacterium]
MNNECVRHGFLCVVLTFACVFAVGDSTCGQEVSAKQGPALAQAAEQRDWNLIEPLLREGHDPSLTQPDGMTALHWAAYHGHVPTVGTLVATGVEIDSRTRYGVTPLSIAAHAGDAELVEILLGEGAEVNRKLPSGETPLMLAARSGSLETLRLLIDAGAKVKAAEKRGQTALMWAAAEGHLEIAHALLDAGAERDRTIGSGFDALKFAAREGKIEVALALIKAGADVNHAMEPKWGGERAPRKGMTALMLATESGHFELALKLVELGADPNDQQSGFTPLHAVSWVRRTSIGDNPAGDPPPRGSGSVTSLQFVRRLVEMGADVNARLERGHSAEAVFSNKGATPFLLAAKTVDMPLMKLLLELGADPLAKNADESTALMASAGIGVIAVGEEPGTVDEVLAAIDWLVSLGVDVNAKDKRGQTAMHGAAYRNYPEAVTRLAKHGADPKVWDKKNKYGHTPEMIAAGKRPGSLKPSPPTIAALEKAKLQFRAAN